MQMSLLLAVGAGKAVMAAQSVVNGTATTATIASSVAMPSTVGEFDLVGCAGDKANFANYKMVAQSEHMSLNLCAASCPSKYFATHDDECHCADESDDLTESTPESCAIPCPGDNKEACGGAGVALARRGGGGKLCTVYMRREAPKVETKIETHVQTITACPPVVTDCPVRPHVTTHTKTITTSVCPEPEWHKKKIVCYGSNCAPEWPCKGDDCKHERVVCKDDHCWTEPCEKGEEWTKLVIIKNEDECEFEPECKGDDCEKKIVCFDGKCVIEKCVGDECSKNLVCHDDECRHVKCEDKDHCHQKMVCEDGKECKPEPHCDGDHCPKPEPHCDGDHCPKPEPPCNGDHCPKPEPPCNGDHCPKPEPPCNGDHCPKPEPPCNGDHCPKPEPPCNGDHCPKPEPPCNGDKCPKPVGPPGKNENKPAPGGTVSGTGAPRPTLPPMVGSAERNGITLFGVLAGLAILL